MENRESGNKGTLQFYFLRVYVKEIYGTLDNPQYRPLANVTVLVNSSIFCIIWQFHWSGKTNESGTTGGIYVAPIYFMVTVSKDGYHTYKCKPFKIVFIDVLPYGYVDVYFTMAENGSPFVKQISQSKQQSNSQGSNPLTSYSFKYYIDC